MEIFNLITAIIIALLVPLFPIGIVAGIIFAVFYSNEENAAKKKRNFWVMISCFGGPVVLLFTVLTLSGLIAMLKAIFIAP